MKTMCLISHNKLKMSDMNVKDCNEINILCDRIYISFH
jgi:hypothetical protein